MNEPALPCPFCGNRLSFINEKIADVHLIDKILKTVRWCVICDHCSALGPARVTPDEAEQAWNSRAVQEESHDMQYTIEVELPEVSMDTILRLLSEGKLTTECTIVLRPVE